MFRYSIKKINGQVTNVKELEHDVENPFEYEVSIGLVGYQDNADAVLDEQGNEIQPAKVRNFEIVKEDISAELAAKEQAKQKLDSARNDLKAVKSLIADAKDATTDVKQRQVLVKLAKAVLQLSKAAGIADANESEE
jgi:hypothetical protein